jgi:hypothetical protein
VVGTVTDPYKSKSWVFLTSQNREKRGDSTVVGSVTDLYKSKS